ncbi:MAG: ATP-binding protein [Desulfovibrio sp.]|nr:ATP-binding protein [Desulfovibrio sp.]
MDIELPDGIEMLCGDRLLADVEEAARLPRRDCFASLKRYLGRPAGKLMLVNGLRRTDKTVMAKQAIAELPDSMLESTVFLKASHDLVIPHRPVYDLVEELYFDKKIRTFFIDECTALLEFPAWSKMMADGPAARGCHVVLLGNDSLSMWIAERELLEGRYNEIRTTRIPFHEWKRLLKGNGIHLGVKDYIRYGGILDFDGVPTETALVAEARNSFRDPSSIAWYIHSSIALNIQNSLARHAAGRDFGPLRMLWESGRLTEAIARIVQDQNQRIALNELYVPYVLGDYYVARNAARELSDGVKKYFKNNGDSLKKQINERLCISNNQEEILQITKKEVSLILRYLSRIDVFRNADVRVMPSTVPEKRHGQLLYEESVRTLQTQPGIRAGQMNLACGVVWEVLKINQAPVSKEEFLKKAEATVQGQMLEDIVFADLQDVLPKDCRIFKLAWDADPGETAEFDCAVVDERDSGNPRVSLFEVKHTASSRGGPEKHMKNPRAIAQVAEAFGRVVSRTIVYSGPTERRAVLWVNADEFLESVGRDPEGCLFPQLSARWSPLVPFEPWLASAADPACPAEEAPAPQESEAMGTV